MTDKYNVELIVDDSREIVELNIQDSGFNNIIEDSAGAGDYSFTWSADKLYKKFLSFEGISKDYIDEALLTKVDKKIGMGLSETSFTKEEKDKLLSIAEGATKNASDNFLLSRDNHTGEQPISSISGLVEELSEIHTIFEGMDLESIIDTLNSVRGDVLKNAEAIDAVDASLSVHASDIDARLTGIDTKVYDTEFKVETLSESMAGKVDKEVGKGLSTNDFSTNLKTKLANIQDNATNNSDDSYLLDRGNHSGRQPISTVTNLTETLLTKVDKQDGMGLSATSFTQEEKDKLASLQGNGWRGVFKDIESLPDDASIGDYADVDGGVGKDIFRMLWDSTDSKWVRVGGVSTALTDAQIKQQYENNPDTNVFSDSSKAKLDSVQHSATKNSDDSFLVDRVNHVGSQPISTITNLQKTLDTINSTTTALDNGKVDKVSGMGLSETSFTNTLKSKVDSVEVGATKNRVDALNADKVHKHILADISGLDESLGNKVSVSDTSIVKSPDKVLRLNGEGMIDFSVLPTNLTSIGFGLSEDEDGSIQVGKTLDNGFTHVIDLDELGEDKLFAIGREFDQFGMLTRGISFLEDQTGIREGAARVLVRKGFGIPYDIQNNPKIDEDQVRMSCTIELDSTNTSIVTGEGKQFIVWNMEGGRGSASFAVRSGVFAYDQNFTKQSGENDYQHNAKVVTLGYHNEVVGGLEDRISALESTLNSLMYSIYEES